MPIRKPLSVILGLAFVSATYALQADTTLGLEEVTVVANRVANEDSATSAATLATALRYDPGVDVQSRGLAEGQADLVIRGASFESAAISVGAVSIRDPQTGHYLLELPIDPDFLSEPSLALGSDGVLVAQNATIGAVAYTLKPIEQRAQLRGAWGDDRLSYQSLSLASVVQLNEADIGVRVAATRSSSDGSVANGDHDFERLNVALQRRTDFSQSDLILAHQDKFLGWPGAYTGFASLPETDHTKTSLLLLNHRQATNAGWYAISAYHRSLDDDYDFDRRTKEAGAAGSFDHKTRNWGLGLRGQTDLAGVNYEYAVQHQADELVRSTDLTEGSFRSRQYISAVLAPTWEVSGQSADWRFKAGVVYQDTSRSEPFWGALGSATWISKDLPLRLNFDYSDSSQVPGYTALKSRPAGLFGGNANLGREESAQWSTTLTYLPVLGEFSASLFKRSDDDLVDWTYSTNQPSARQANAVDLDVKGVEVFWRANAGDFTWVLGWTHLNKNANYGSALVDASYYALNYAKQRLTAAVTWRMGDQWQVKFDNEYRRQAENPLRIGSDAAYFGSVSLVYSPVDVLELALVVDNVSDEDFQRFPGSPAARRSASLQVTLGLL
ncbi:MAG: hypothetical protein ACPF9H_04435 [Aequoribacter sp.]|uniref:hypothetical protein n=1 Tax=Aequoribacter sp. TaxID=2847771 RepID=UPI003C3EC96A